MTMRTKTLDLGLRIVELRVGIGGQPPMTYEQIAGEVGRSGSYCSSLFAHMRARALYRFGRKQRGGTCSPGDLQLIRIFEKDIANPTDGPDKWLLAGVMRA